MNVLYLLNHAGKAGTERYVEMLIRGAPRYGVRPFFAYNESGALLEKVLRMGISCARIEMRNPFDLKAAHSLAGFCVDNGIDLVHTHYLRENYIALIAKCIYLRSLKVVYTNHFVISNGVLIRAANSVLTRFNHRIIAISDASMLRLKQNCNAPGKIIKIHHAVDGEAWAPGNDFDTVRSETRARYGVAPDETLFLCASRFSAEKGHGFLIDAIKMAAEKARVNFKVILAGDGELEDEIRLRAELKNVTGLVTFAGYIDDLKPLMFASDAYISPSREEAFGVSIIEALASGLPVIATDVGGAGEIVSDERGCGIRVKYGDTEDMSDAILTFLTPEGRAEKKTNAQKAVADSFSLGVMLDKTFAAY